MDEYLAMWLATQRLRETREFAAWYALAREARVARTPVRAVIGLALIRAGRFLVRGTPAWAGPPRS